MLLFLLRDHKFLHTMQTYTEFIQFQDYVFDHLSRMYSNDNDNNNNEEQNSAQLKELEMMNDSNANDAKTQNNPKSSILANSNLTLKNSIQTVEKLKSSKDKSINVAKLEGELISNRFEIGFPSNIPLSSIIYDDDFESGNWAINDSEKWLERAKIKSFHLYKKYVALGSEYEINVSYRTRKDLIDKMDNLALFIENEAINELQMFWMFRQCCTEMIHLIHGSFGRFKSSDHFAKFLQHCHRFNQK